MSADDDVDGETIALTRRERRRREPAEPVESDAGIDESTLLIEDRTVVIDRQRSPASAPTADVADAGIEDLGETLRRRPPVTTEQQPAIYRPRAAPRSPRKPPALAGDIEPTRVIDPAAASVMKSARRRSLVSLSAVAGACIVSVFGLVLLGYLVFA